MIRVCANFAVLCAIFEIAIYRMRITQDFTNHFILFYYHYHNRAIICENLLVSLSNYIQFFFLLTTAVQTKIGFYFNSFVTRIKLKLMKAIEHFENNIISNILFCNICLVNYNILLLGTYEELQSYRIRVIYNTTRGRSKSVVGEIFKLLIFC